MKQYFGILNNDIVNDFSVQGQFDFMIENELFYVSRHYSIEKTEIENPKTDLKPTQTVINAFYDYLKRLFSREIDQSFLHFFNDFNESIYGLDKAAQRKIALGHFNERYKKIKVLEASFVKREKDDNGIEQVKNMNRFDFLKGRQNGQKQQLATTENTLQFLNGNATYFESKQFKNNTTTKQFIEFEANLKILISLNGQHKFEEDFHFTDLAKLKNLFEKYGDIFKSFEVFIYIHKKIHGFTEAKMANITSLFDAVVEMKLVHNSKTNFLNYVNMEHQMELTKLKFYEPEQNRQHDQRVQQFRIELQAYSTEKEELLAQDVEKPYVITSKKKNLKIFTDKDALDYLFKNTFNCK
jgi:hypothetical protein